MKKDIKNEENGENFNYSASSFESTIKEVISLHQSYDKSIQQLLNQPNSRDAKEDNKPEIIDSGNDLFENCIAKFTYLLKLMNELKRQNYSQFMNTFETSNIFIIKLYEFVSKLMNLSIKPSSELDKITMSNQIFFVSRSIELLHVIISNKNENENEDDEFYLACHEQLTKGFNFTSSLCSLLFNYLNKIDVNDEKKQKNLLRDEKYFRMAFTILNKLTLNNRLFTIDCFVSDFICMSINKINQKTSFGNSQFLQFISNVVRKNRKDFETILVARKNFSQFCRNIHSILTNGTGNLVLNACIIYTKLCFEENLPTSLSLEFFKSIDMTLNYLLPNNSSLQNGNVNQNYDFVKENAANYLIEIINRKQVIEFLDKNEEYSILLLVKLNHILLENKPTHNQPALTTSIKVFKILNSLIQNSKLAERLFQVVFNTRELLQKKSTSSEQMKITKKFQDYIKSLDKGIDTKYEIFSDYYIHAAGMSLNSSLLKDLNTTCDNGGMFINNPYFHLNYLEYLLQLFKKNESSKDAKFIEEKISFLFESLNQNFINLQKLYNTNLKCESNLVFENNRELLSKIFFSTISLIEVILKFAIPKKFDACKMAKSLYKMIKFNNEATIDPNCSTIWSIVNDNVILSDENILILSRVLMRFINNNLKNKELAIYKESVYKLFQEEYFIRLLSYAILESNRMELTSIAYEILFELNNASSQDNLNYHFDFKTFIDHNERIKKEKQLEASNPVATHESSEVSANHSKNESNYHNDLREFIEVYEKKLNEKSIQEAIMLNLINQNYSNVLVLELEAKTLRDQLKKSAQYLTEAQKEQQNLESKYLEITKLNQSFKENNLELKKINQKLQDEKQKLNEHCEFMKKESDQMEKENFEALENLGNTLKAEKAGKSQIERKLTETERKVSDLEKSKRTMEANFKETESKWQLRLKELETQIEYKEVLLTEEASKLTIEIERNEILKNENDKLKSILSYVKENYK